MKNSKPETNTTRYEAIGISLASPDKIKEWSHGEVKKAETINYRTLKPEKEGLFCERIFGPEKDHECHCGKYKGIRFAGIVCDKCGVEVTKTVVRRERLGHISLAAPVSHIWYFRGVPSRMGLLLDMTPRSLEKVIYFASYVVIDPGQTGLVQRQILSEHEYNDLINAKGRKAFVAKMGAEAVEELLKQVDIPALAVDLRTQLKTAKGQKKIRIIKRLEVIEAFKRSGNKPEWMIMRTLPVLPPKLRPLVQLDGGRFASADLNELYRRVIIRNNRLGKMLSIGAPDIIVRNEKRMLQESVDALIDNGRRGRPIVGAGNRPLKSLSDQLKGKPGRFRQNLLGKRVDFSGRSVIVIGPNLKLHQCGLPKEMALELFKPFVVNKLVEAGEAQNTKIARRMVERGDDVVWDKLEHVIKDHPVLLNRAPTLHRLGIQAFEPTLVEGRAIKLHPLVCAAFNADFDGDQMAVHLPLSMEAQAEARFLMLSSNNLLKPQDGRPVTVPGQDIVLGCYYLTMEREDARGTGRAFLSLNEAIMAYDNHDIDLHARIKVRLTKELNGEKITRLVESTLGRFIFNGIIPQDLQFVDRTVTGRELDLECDRQFGKKDLEGLIERCIQVHGITDTAEILDNIKNYGYHYSTIAGISIGIFDLIVPSKKQEFIESAEKRVEMINAQYQRGLVNEEGRYGAIVSIWAKTTDAITQELTKNLNATNPVFMMSNSGARGTASQLRQLAGMRGNMSDTVGRAIEIPIKSNFREGMNVLEFFISSHGARKSLSDTALKTADSGYLTRRLVDIAQDVIIREDDCGTSDYIDVSEVSVQYGTSKNVVESLSTRIYGRTAAKDIFVPETDELICSRNELIDHKMAKAIVDAGILSVPIRTNLTCQSKTGVCGKCYGLNLAHGRPAVIGEAVGIMAAQSIGEPGTQLTMRTFHTGGIASGDDITQGLPRVEELFEARKPKGQAIIAIHDGIVRIAENDKRRFEITVTNSEGEIQAETVTQSTTRLVSDGMSIKAGDQITEGSISPQDIMKIVGVERAQSYIIAEVLKVYKNNGVEINDKHIEIVARQMMRRIKIDDPGDTDFLTGSIVDFFEFKNVNAAAEAKGITPASGKRLLMGVTKASLATDSFLSAASFQETTRVLTDAAIKGKIDNLLGLKENVILGRLIPAGTGMPQYSDCTAVPNIDANAELIASATEV